MNRYQLIKQIKEKGSYLCVGLDTDITKIPAHIRGNSNAIFEFNKAMIDATKEHCVAYKINTAFYEALGVKGWEAMEQTASYIPATHLKIADAKRGDIGNTSSQYAKAFFETLNFDAITVAPYMGEDSIRPFLEYENKWTIVLGLTSNAGAQDFEMLHIDVHRHEELPKYYPSLPDEITSHRLYETVITKVAQWGTPDNLMFVAGATQASELSNIRKIIPDNFLLVPGIGAQGGSLREVSSHGLNKDCGLLVNASRAIIYASGKEDFNEAARKIAQEYQNEMRNYLPSLTNEE